MLITNAWAQDAATQAGGMGVLFSYLPILLIFAVFYFLVMRPQGQQAKARAAMLTGLKVGDTVVLLAGFVGVVRKVFDKEKLLEVEVLPGGERAWVERSSVERVWADKASLPKIAPEPSVKKR